MAPIRSEKHYLKALDANFNRSREGLRVCEDLSRFILHSRKLTADARALRHRISSILKKMDYGSFVKYRDSVNDVGKSFHQWEKKRENYKDLLIANLQRVKESLRVLEEFLKISDDKTAATIKEIRFDVYELEKRAVKKISRLRNY